MTKKKSFDCVEMKRRAADEIARRLAGMNVEERLSHWRERTESLRRRQAERREEDRDRPARSA